MTSLKMVKITPANFSAVEEEVYPTNTYILLKSNLYVGLMYYAGIGDFLFFSFSE